MIRAKDVMVAKVFQAQCWIEGCGWAGELKGSFQEAGTDRQKHLDWHRAQEAEARP